MLGPELCCKLPGVHSSFMVQVNIQMKLDNAKVVTGPVLIYHNQEFLRMKSY